jgi:predicted Rdx family selenoprotein
MLDLRPDARFRALEADRQVLERRIRDRLHPAPLLGHIQRRPVIRLEPLA